MKILKFIILLLVFKQLFIVYLLYKAYSERKDGSRSLSQPRM
jgi:hypothetical protein